MEEREISFVEVAGRAIPAVHCICPVCKTLDLNTEFKPHEDLDGIIATCPNGHEWHIPKSEC